MKIAMYIPLLYNMQDTVVDIYIYIYIHDINIQFELNTNFWSYVTIYLFV